MDRKSVLTTIANENHLDYAKQVFASSYFKGKWKDDFLLLVLGNAPEEKLIWFYERKIQVLRVEPSSEQMDFIALLALAKAELFKVDFKQWERVVYLDTDMMIRRPLGSILNVENFGGVQGIGKPRVRNRLRQSFLSETKNLISQLKEDFNVDLPGINGGFFCFNTNIIHEETYSQIENFVRKYWKITGMVDECALSLIFGDKLELLPLSFNVYLYRYGINSPERAKGAILHFVGTGILKPWNPSSPFFIKWKQNLSMSDKIKIETNNLNNTLCWEKDEFYADERFLRSRLMRFRLFKYPIIKVKQSVLLSFKWLKTNIIRKLVNEVNLLT